MWWGVESRKKEARMGENAYLLDIRGTRVKIRFFVLFCGFFKICFLFCCFWGGAEFLEPFQVLSLSLRFISVPPGSKPAVYHDV